MKLILALTLLCLYQIIEAKPSEPKEPERASAWEEHKKKHGLNNLSAAEEKERKGHYDAADDFINTHNAAGHKSKMAHNHLSHMSESEKKQLRGAVIPAQSRLDEIPIVVDDRCDPNDIAVIDWRDVNGTNYLAPIQNQGQCGSCWAFSATASLESRWAIKHGGDVPKLSEQNIVDCCHKYSTSAPSNGCNGGFYCLAWSYVASHKGFSVGSMTGENPAALPKPVAGQDYESQYPYTAKAGTCAFTGNVTVYTVPYNTTVYSWVIDSTGKNSATYAIKQKSPAAFKAALQSGPISVAIDATGNVFNYYKSGTIEASQLGTSIDHAVNMIGYGSDSNGKYWLMRNSWGTGWGESGYMKFERTDEEGSVGTGAVLMYGMYPSV